jgi:hypothetical protein
VLCLTILYRSNEDFSQDQNYFCHLSTQKNLVQPKNCLDQPKIVYTVKSLCNSPIIQGFSAKGIEINKNGISLKLVPRFQGFMVDYMVAERSKSAIFWHGVKNPDVLQKHWKVQKDNTTYPKCQPIENFKVIFKKTTPYVLFVFVCLFICLNQ